MTAKSDSTRRSFLKGGALLAAPLGLAAASPAKADEDETRRLARLEAEAAIRELHQTWLKRINAGAKADSAQLGADPDAVMGEETVRRITADPDREPDAIELAADGNRATGRFPCIVELESSIAQDCTPARMAHAQGGGIRRRRARRVLTVDYVKKNGAWAITEARFASA